MELVDTDGDQLTFRITAAGSLRLYVNGKLDIRDIRSITYSNAHGHVNDDTGSFQLREETRVEEALGLRLLASRCSVEWHGDEPLPANKLALTDTDGDHLEFILTDGKLCELNNGQLELEEVRKIRFDFSSGTVQDDSGEFTLSRRYCIQQVAALHSLAQQSGIEWSGDDPCHPLRVLRSKVLDIENCDSGWEFQCPKVWESLSATGKANERFCDTCKEVVYFCSTEAELEEHTRQRRCVAFDLATPTESSGEELSLHIVRLSGEELPAMHLPAASTIALLKQKIERDFGIPAAEQSILKDEEELLEDQVLSAVATGAELALQLLQVQRPGVKQESEPRVRKMGKRRRARP